MKNKKTTNNNIAAKISSSLVLKLNFNMMGRLFIGFLKLNILIILISFFVMLWNGERKAGDIVNGIERNPQNYMYYFYDDLRVSTAAELKGGYVFPKSVSKWLPVDIEGARRSFVIDRFNPNLSLYKRIDYLKYTIGFSLDGTDYIIEYSLGRNISTFINIFITILVFELIILIGDVSKGHRAIRRALKPIDELTQSAKNLQMEMKGNSDKYIRDLAGKISTIDADKLEKRITVDTSQEELKELARAINHMLDRINSSYKAQIRFVSDASHELRTPISVIQGYVNLLDRWGKDDPKVMEEAINAIKSESENMKELIEKLLFLARSDNGTIQMHMETIDACDVVDEITRETQMIDENHRFEAELKRPALIYADKQLLKQALRILVDNSIKFTPQGKDIMLKAYKKDNKVHVAVQDNGIGIEPKDLPHLFDRFYRSDESRARGTGGSGLGLSIAKWIVERHEAYFEVLSRVNIGTRITIVFPEAEMNSEKPETEEKQ
ncbi:MAG TPA: HAMP domain-containing protein [Tissierellia bacterium]|nr:HAMP domain-containing protein [Tissierellia bacterium]